MDSTFRQETLIQAFDSAWFFSNVLSSPSPVITNPKPTDQNKFSKLESEPNKPTIPIPEIHPIPSPRSKTSVVQEESPESTDPDIRPVDAPEEKRKKANKKRRELTVKREIDFLILMMGLGGRSFEEVVPRMYYHDDKAMKRHLRYWALAVASNLAMNHGSMVVAACS